MRWFAHKRIIGDEDHLLVDWDETTFDDSTGQRRDPAVRKLINGATIVLVVAIIGVSAHWWLGPATDLWATVFPPPPYTGTLVYGMMQGKANSDLVAFRITDGHEQWRVQNVGGEASTILRDTNTMYVVDTDTHHVQALQAQTGRQIWHMTTDTTLTLDGGWLAYNRIYLLLNAAGSETTSPLLEAVDAPSGHVLWKSALPGAHPFPVGLHTNSVLFCATEHIANTAPTTLTMAALNAQTGEIQWRQSTAITADGSYTCGEIGDMAFIQNFGNTVENTLSLIDEQTGIIQRQMPLLGQITSANQDVIFTFTYEVPPPEQVIQAVSLDTGKVLWQLTGTYNPFYTGNADGNILPSQPFIIADTTGLVGLDQQTGAVIWRWSNAEINATTINLNLAVAGAGSMLYFASHQHMYALDSTTGKLVWQAPLPPTANPIIQYLYASSLLFVSDQGHFLALQAPDGKIRWRQNCVLLHIFP